VAWVCEDERRRNRVAQAAWDAGLDGAVHLFASREEVTDRRVLGPSWWRPGRVGGVATLLRSDLFETVAADRSVGGNGSGASEPRLQASTGVRPIGCFTPGGA
jgi:hypothetical protein